MAAEKNVWPIMILLELRDYIKEHKMVRLSDLARHFDIPESAVQPMVEHWVRKGNVVAQKMQDIVATNGCSSGGSCSSCSVAGCDSPSSIIYRWRQEA